MTEEEAKTKWCFRRPSRALRSDGTLYSSDEQACVGSVCMAWRWTGEKDTPQLGSTDFALGVLGDERARAEVQARTLATRKGFCGLAGQP